MTLLLSVLAPLAQAEPSAAPPEHVAQVVQYAAFLGEHGGWLTTSLIAALAAGGIFCALTILDWNRQRWGLVMPVLMLLTGVVLAVFGVALFLGFSGLQEINLYWRGLTVAPSERALLDLALGAVAQYGAWILAGLSGALLFGTLGVVALVRRWRARRPALEHPEWQE